MIDREFHLTDHDLYQRVFELTAQIPRGRVGTYGDIARALGDVIASRAVGQILSADLTRPFEVPCHRVIYSDGRTGWYMGMGRGEERKREMLRSEGVPMAEGKVLGLDKVRFNGYHGEAILSRMAEGQRELARSVSQEGDATRFLRIAGLDVAYDGDRAFSAMVTVDREGEVLDECHAQCQVSFPYVPTYLGFREMRPYSLVLGDGRRDTLYLVDGHGRAHPRRAGVACQFGVVHDVVCAGVAKSLLTGKLENDTLRLDGEEVGRVIDLAGRSRAVSIGHRVDLGSLCRLLRALPQDPIHLAHLACGRARRER